MKLCQVCGATAALDAHVCGQCGEASWCALASEVLAADVLVVCDAPCDDKPLHEAAAEALEPLIGRLAGTKRSRK